MAGTTISNDTDPDHFWVGTEVLRTYSGDGAQQALTDLRALIARCPSTTGPPSGILAGTSSTYAVRPGPRLGDDSVHVICTFTDAGGVMQCDSVLIRVGSTLVSVLEQGADPGPVGDRDLNQLAEAAFRQYQAPR